MKRLVAAWILVLVAYPAHAIELTPIESGPSCPEIHNTQLCAKSLESELLKRYPSVVDTTDSHIRIRLESDQWRTIENPRELLFVVNISKDQRFLYIFEQYYEGSTWKLFDRASGKLFHTVGYPVFSPSRKLFVSVQQDLDASYSPNLLTVYEFENRDIRIQADLSGEDDSWGPGHVEWLSEDTFLFEKTWLNPDPDGVSHFISETWIATRSRDAWKTRQLD